MVRGTDNSKSVKVSIKNVVYKEIFESHSQTEPMEDTGEICSLLNHAFPSSQLTSLLGMVTPTKRESILSGTNGKDKVIEFIDNTFTRIEYVKPWIPNVCSMTHSVVILAICTYCPILHLIISRIRRDLS